MRSAGATGFLVVLIPIAAGLALLVTEGEALVRGAVALAARFSVSALFIGLTVAGFGTSTPWLVTSAVPALRSQGDLAFGNVVGSNRLNLLGTLGVTALVHPIAKPGDVTGVDVLILAVSTAGLATVAASGWRVTRIEGSVLTMIYGLYLIWVLARAGLTGAIS